MSASTSSGQLVGYALACSVPILLQKSLLALANSDSVAVKRFAAEAGDDGAAQSGSGAAVLFVLSR